MMHTHRVVGCDRAINEGPGLLSGVQLAHFLKDAVLLPEAQQFPLLRGEIDFIGYFFEHPYLQNYFLSTDFAAERQNQLIEKQIKKPIPGQGRV
jgi:hypothetical protein